MSDRRPRSSFHRVRAAPALVPALAAAVSAAGPDTGSLEARLAALEARVATLESGGSERWLTEARAEALAALTRNIVADAGSRASCLNGGIAAGHDGGFFVGSADGRFRLHIGGQLQIRYVYNHHDGGTDTLTPAGIAQAMAEGDRNRSGFEVRRARIRLDGHIGDPRLMFRVQGAFARSGGDLRLQDSFIEYELDGGWSVRTGQYRIPLLREARVSSTRQLTVERSLVQRFFGPGRSPGAGLRYSGEHLRIDTMFSNGANQTNGSWSTEDTEWALTTRLEWRIAGTWTALRDFTSFRADEPAWMLGGGVHYERDEFGTGGGDGNDDEIETLVLTADVTGELGGANVFATVIYRSLDPRTGSGQDQLGLVAQAGVMLTDELEGFVRYEWIDLDLPDVRDAGETVYAWDDLSVLTVGLTRYFDGHRAKWTNDLGYGLQRVESPAASTSRGYRSDTGGDEGQIVFRSQLQLVF